MEVVVVRDAATQLGTEITMAGSSATIDSVEARARRPARRV